ncbi:MAG: ion transporter [Bacteroidales bacterium]|nr:ion transporter [Bacteroidales bacterium]
MKLKDRLVDAFWRVRKRVAEVDYRHLFDRIFGWIGAAMHKVLFEWLMPKRYRNITRKEIFEIVFKSDTPAGKRFDVWLLVLIVANIVLLLVDSLTGTTSTMTSRAHLSVSYIVFKVLEWAFTILFTFEYYLRIYCLKHPRKYVFSFWGVIDFLSIFPAYLSLFVPVTQSLTVLRLLRVMRVFRIFKMERFQEEAFHLLSALRASAVKILIFMLFVLIAAVILGTLMYTFENEANPAFKSIPTGIYWAVVTITTVGYGDVVPVTSPGRFLSVLVMLLGYSIIAVPTGIVAGETMREYKRPANRRRKSVLKDEYAEEEEAIRN